MRRALIAMIAGFVVVAGTEAQAQTCRGTVAIAHSANSPDAATFLRDAGGIIGAGAKPTEFRAFLDALAQEAETHAMVAEAGVLGLAKGLARHGQSLLALSSPASLWGTGINCARPSLLVVCTTAGGLVATSCQRVATAPTPSSSSNARASPSRDQRRAKNSFMRYPS